MGATNSRGSGLLLNTGLLFPKLVRNQNTVRTESGASFALKEAKMLSLPCVVEGQEASSPRAVVHSTVQTFHSDCNPHLEPAAVKHPRMTHLNSPQRSKNDDEG